MTGTMAQWRLAALVAFSFGANTVAAQQATQFKPPAPGSVFTYRASVDGKSGGMTYSTVLKDQTPYEGLPAYRVKQEYGLAKGKRTFFQVQIHGLKDGNVVAGLNAKGETAGRIRPHTGDYSWPIFVGKGWTHSFLVEEKGRKSGSSSFTWNVAAYEVVTVPAGKFTAFRIEGTGIGAINGKVTRWFAPKLGFDVKSIEKGKDGKTYVMELTNVVVPEPKSPATTNPGLPPDSQ